MLKIKNDAKILFSLIITSIMMLGFYANQVNASTWTADDVENLKLSYQTYIKVDLDFLVALDTNKATIKNKYMSMIENYYEKQLKNLLKDNEITVKAVANDVATSNGYLNLDTDNYVVTLEIYKDNSLVATKENVIPGTTIPVINVPSTVSDNELTDYVKNIITKTYPNYGGGITSVEKGGTKPILGMEYPYTYLVHSTAGMDSAILINKEVEEDSLETYEPITAVDNTTNIKLEATTDVLPSNTIMAVNKITEGETYNKVKTALTNVKKFTVYDITLTSSNVKIQPKGKVKISIPIPSDFNKSNLVVYRIAEDGTKTEYTVNVNGDDATFETDHFSTYVLAEKVVTTDKKEKVATTNKKEKDNTPKTGNMDIINYVGLIAIISIVGIIITNKRK